MDSRSLGILLVGIGGSVGSTVLAGIELIRSGRSSLDGLPFAGAQAVGEDALTPYESIVVQGWDTNAENLYEAAKRHGVIPGEMLQSVAGILEERVPWPALEMTEDGGGMRSQVERVRQDISRFKSENSVNNLVVVLVASTEPSHDLEWLEEASLEELEAALDDGTKPFSPSVLYCYAALAECTPFVNFTPNRAFEFPALLEIAARNRVPLAGKDGKTGQTFLKTVLAPALRSRALRVDGWYSTNLLGNSDGEALADPDACKTKVATKSGVLDAILGYEVADHIVDIRYYRPRGDDKEAWDSIDVTGFLGGRMQLKMNFLCRDSLLAAPLVIELCRLMVLANQGGGYGIQPQLGWFFKAPTPSDLDVVEHDFFKQQVVLKEWLNSRGITLER
jgi:myo-inositol-1-phosphate synthase